MKTLKLLLIMSLFASCSNDEESTTDNGYNYSLQKVFHPKIDLEAGLNSNRVPILKLLSYTVDTLELNMSNNSSYGFQIDFQASESFTEPSDELVHVKYLKFINIISEPEGITNPVNSIILTNDDFTYSSSNVNLNNVYPDLFITNIFTGAIYNPVQIPFNVKHPDYIKDFTSSNLYEIGDVLIISGNKFEVITRD